MIRNQATGFRWVSASKPGSSTADVTFVPMSTPSASISVKQMRTNKKRLNLDQKMKINSRELVISLISDRVIAETCVCATVAEMAEYTVLV